MYLNRAVSAASTPVLIEGVHLYERVKYQTEVARTSGHVISHQRTGFSKFNCDWSRNVVD